MENRYLRLFPRARSVIGMIALAPSPGYPQHPGMTRFIDRALADLETLQRGGVDGVCVENDYDQPHTLMAGPEVVAAMTRVTAEVVRHARVPVGTQVLLNDPIASLAVAHASGAHFVRLDFFVDRVRIPAGEIEPEPERVIAFRLRLGADDVALLCDVQVKYSALLEPGKSVTVSAQQAIAAGADAVIVTGPATGDPPNVEHLREARAACGAFPLLIGSGLAPANAGALLAHANGAIVGTALRTGRTHHDVVSLEKVRQLMHAAGA